MSYPEPRPSVGCGNSRKFEIMPKTQQETEIFDGFAGGGPPSSDALRSTLVVPQDLVVKSDLDKQVARLLILHPDLQIKFRNNNLANLDDQTKRELLQDMREVLGIAQLNDEDFR